MVVSLELIWTYDSADSSNYCWLGTLACWLTTLAPLGWPTLVSLLWQLLLLCRYLHDVLYFCFCWDERR